MKKSIMIMVLMVFANIAIAKTLVTLQQLQGIWQRTEDTYKVDTQTWTFKKQVLLWKTNMCIETRLTPVNMRYSIIYLKGCLMFTMVPK